MLRISKFNLSKFIVLITLFFYFNSALSLSNRNYSDVETSEEQEVELFCESQGDLEKKSKKLIDLDPDQIKLILQYKIINVILNTYKNLLDVNRQNYDLQDDYFLPTTGDKRVTQNGILLEFHHGFLKFLWTPFGEFSLEDFDDMITKDFTKFYLEFLGELFKEGIKLNDFCFYYNDTGQIKIYSCEFILNSDLSKLVINKSWYQELLEFIGIKDFYEPEEHVLSKEEHLKRLNLIEAFLAQF